MIVNFKNYSYVGNDDDDNTYDGEDKKDKAFDQNKFNEFIQKHDYRSLVAYASQYRFNDIKQQMDFMSSVNAYRQEEQIREAKYANITTDDDRAKVDFAEAIFKPGGLDMLKDETYDGVKGNKYAEEFIKFKNSIGSTDGDNAQYLQLTFKNKEQTLSGKKYTAEDKKHEWYDPRTWIRAADDYLAPDNDNDITAFYDRLGVTEDELRSKGVQISYNEKGDATVKFSKDNDFANAIIYDLGKSTGKEQYKDWLNSNLFEKTTSLSSFDKDGKELLSEHNIGGGINGESNINNIYTYFAALNPAQAFLNMTQLGSNRGMLVPGYENQELLDNQYKNAARAFNLINDCSELRDQYFAKYDGPIQYTGTIFNDDDDYVLELKEQYEKDHSISYDTYTKALDRWQKGKKGELLKNIGSAHYQMFSNALNEEGTSETLKELSNKDRAILMNHISKMDSSKMSMHGYLTDNNIIGTMLMIDEDTAEKMGYDKKRIQVFIPGFQYEKQQAKLNSSSKGQTCREINSMQEYGYTYNTSDGGGIKYNGDGTYTQYANSNDKTGTIIQHEDALREVEKDYMIRMGTTLMAYKYLNRDHKTVTKDGDLGYGFAEYAEEARAQAYNLADELYPNIEYKDVEGNPLSIDDVYDLYSKPTDVEANLYKKIETVQDLYDKFLAAGSKFKY